MELLDVHTHHLSTYPGRSILNLMPGDLCPTGEVYCSVGIHPWQIDEYEEEVIWEQLLLSLKDPCVIAIGEAGIDKLISVSLVKQLAVFEKQIVLSEEKQLPLIIHCVHAVNEIIQLKKKYAPHMPWVMHGFRGKKELALQCVNHHIFLSFGEKYNEEALKGIPLSSILMETDGSKADITCLYDKAAKLLSLSADDLKLQIQQNINRVFFDH